MGITVFIAGSPRTGGNWLTHLLRENGLCCGDEYASSRFYHMFQNTWDNSRKAIKAKDEVEYYWKKIREYRSIRGVFCVKIHWSESREPWVGKDFKKVLIPGEPVIWVWQTRDFMDQGNSMAHCRETGTWYERVPGRHVHPSEAKKCASFCEWEHDQWNKFFFDNHIDPIAIPYEELCRDPQQYVNRIRMAVEYKRTKP
jgi:LPS sulfotransferase NodH